MRYISVACVVGIIAGFCIGPGKDVSLCVRVEGQAGVCVHACIFTNQTSFAAPVVFFVAWTQSVFLSVLIFLVFIIQFCFHQ